jgi:hypothetical protein
MTRSDYLGNILLNNQRDATQYRINQEIKYLYNKKLKLNEQLYKLHLECADNWPNTWPIILIASLGYLIK